MQPSKTRMQSEAGQPAVLVVPAPQAEDWEQFVTMVRRHVPAVLPGLLEWLPGPARGAFTTLACACYAPGHALPLLVLASEHAPLARAAELQAMFDPHRFPTPPGLVLCGTSLKTEDDGSERGAVDVIFPSPLLVREARHPFLRHVLDSIVNALLSMYTAQEQPHGTDFSTLLAITAHDHPELVAPDGLGGVAVLRVPVTLVPQLCLVHLYSSQQQRKAKEEKGSPSVTSPPPAAPLVALPPPSRLIAPGWAQRLTPAYLVTVAVCLLLVVVLLVAGRQPTGARRRR